jgi:UDP-N-acetylmuramate: L-alanyl-gamma-D-glutamyl-meso-diaminopimelate ligase
LAQNEETILYRDFAHAPSKVKATIDAVKEQFPLKKVIAVLELHTYSSLNEKFTKEYEGVMEKADVGAVFFSRHALKIKGLPELPKETVKAGFNNASLKVFDERNQLEEWLEHNNYDDSVVLFMSSGNYEGIDVDAFAERITSKAS